MSGILTLDQAVQARARIRETGLSLVFTNGHFDLLHVGHLDYLERARALGGALFVGINDDASTAALKGAGRPLIPAAERARLVAALRCVDGVIIFSGLTAGPLIEALRPDIYAKGGDYQHKTLPEKPIVEAYGGQVVLIDLVPERSTTALIARVRALPGVR
ncbi:MAG: adenylyltransferase/cytidyltransferase family protein [Anaerolineae bacterium]|nr:adenylyltransferase/cytidyltransferase family protein [Anaerolineae bacterium]